MNVYEALQLIQSKIVVPKGQRNDFGKYNYRSLEDICAAAKKLLSETQTTLTFNDEMVFIGNRVYVKATATLTDIDGKTISTVAYAREPENKKGMDESQITGAASSYARKYAANGLFSIDDTKDADAMRPEEKTKIIREQPKKCTQAEIEEIETALMETNSDFDKFCSCVGIKMLVDLDSETIKKARNLIEIKRKANANS